MDIVTKNLLKTFQTEESLLSDIEESVLFEHFANFCILAKEYSEEFSLENIHTGDGGDMAIDGIAIFKTILCIYWKMAIRSSSYCKN